MIKIRKFLPSDLEKVKEIENISFSKRQAYSRKYFEKLHQNYPQGFIVAENDKEVIGYTIGRPRNNQAGEIISIAVSPNWRQQGIGGTLTNVLINHFKEKNLKEISLHVRTENEGGTAFYQNLGFKILETIKNYYQNGDNACLMIKEI